MYSMSANLAHLADMFDHERNTTHRKIVNSIPFGIKRNIQHVSQGVKANKFFYLILFFDLGKILLPSLYTNTFHLSILYFIYNI